MKRRQEIDPELHILRSTIRGCAEGRDRSDLETARFGIFAAFEGRDDDGARRWCKALRAALLATESTELRQIGLEALQVIEGAIDE